MEEYQNYMKEHTTNIVVWKNIIPKFQMDQKLVGGV